MSRPQLLVSVRDAAEAQAALQGGANLIDVKDPSQGSLGRADLAVVEQVVEWVSQSGASETLLPVSAALGELADWHEGKWWQQEQWEALLPGLSFVKIGLAQAGAQWCEQLTEVLTRVGSKKLVVAAYADADRADSPSVETLIDWAIAERAAGVLIDTAVKDGRGLLSWCEIEQLRLWASRLHAAGLRFALAGSLKAEQLDEVSATGANIIAVRGAACEGCDRQGRVAAERVRQLVESLKRHEGVADRG